MSQSENAPAAWHQQPAAQAVIAGMFRLSGIAESLDPFASQLWANDPAAVIGVVEEYRELGDRFNDHWVYSAPGGSAVEACLESLTALRDQWIDAQVDAAGGDEVERLDLAEELMRAAASVDAAIEAWRTAQAELPRAA